MTRKHYEAIARTLALDTDHDTRRRNVDLVCDLLHRTFDNFDHDKFRRRVAQLREQIARGGAVVVARSPLPSELAP